MWRPPLSIVLQQMGHGEDVAEDGEEVDAEAVEAGNFVADGDVLEVVDEVEQEVCQTRSRRTTASGTPGATTNSTA